MADNIIYKRYKDLIGCKVLPSKYKNCIGDFYITELLTANGYANDFTLRTVELSIVECGKFIVFGEFFVDELEFFISDLNDDVLTFEKFMEYFSES